MVDKEILLFKAFLNSNTLIEFPDLFRKFNKGSSSFGRLYLLIRHNEEFCFNDCGRETKKIKELMVTNTPAHQLRLGIIIQTQLLKLTSNR